MPFYPEMPTGRHPERNPIFRPCHCHNELAPKLVNPQEFSLETNKVAALIKKLTLIYEYNVMLIYNDVICLCM